jgi:class 3 adenylate cyclase/predicted ATPase
MDVGGWLRNLGLGKYEAAFCDHAIDEEVLRHLTAEDLKEIGVATVGDRRKLLAAITELAAPSPSMGARSPPPEISAERRPITVMFCDLVGSTSLSVRLDAEDWRNLVSAYLDAASAAVTELGGHVLKKLGDGLMALFGYPRAQENDSERAVRAALLIQRALADLNRKNAGMGTPELVARIGIDSGAVVVDATGEVFGHAPNIAARVQAAAEPGTVMVTARVQRQTAGLFVAEDRGAHPLKGAPEPTTLFRIVRASGGRRFGARVLTPLVGREEELGLLRRRWERAARGEGQFVQIVGEPGIGKSRLIEEFRLKLAEAPHTFVEWSASQLLQNTPLHPVAEWGRQRFGGAETPAPERLADLENTLQLVGLDPGEYAPLLAPLVDIPLTEERAAKLAPEELRRRQLAAFQAWVLAGARSQAVVLAFEDLHWADPTSLDLMRTLAERGAQAPLLIIATARPEFRPPWSLRSHHSVISLSPLDRADVAQMVGELAHRHALSKEVVEGVSERTGGVPLFVEEVTRLLLERGEEGGAHAIPPTLQQSLAARLDRLGEAREVAQISAVLGRDFTYGLLAAVAASFLPRIAGEGDHAQHGGGVADPALQSALDRLAGADLLIAEGAGHEATYRFKHALIQDAAYDSLLKSRRQALHRRAAEVLRDIPERAAAEPEVIAHHFTSAGLDDLAIEWWGKAGDQALRRSAFQEAIAHLGRAIAMADRVDQHRPSLGARAENEEIAGAAAGRDRRPRLHVAYGNTLIAARGFGAPETTEAFAKARASSTNEGDAPERLAADFGLWAGSYTRGELRQMRAHAAAFLADVKERSDSPEAGVAHRVQGITHWFAGEFLEAPSHLERALALFEPGRDDDLGYRFGMDPGVPAMAYLGLTLWPLGEIDRAIALVERMRERGAGLTHANTIALGALHAVVFELMRRDRSRVRTDVSNLARIVREHDLRLFRAFGVFFEGWAMADAGALAEGLESMRCGAENLREQNALVFDGRIKIALAEAEARAGDPEGALAVLDEALATAERAGYRAFEADLCWARGEILLKRDPTNPTPAEQAFQTAINVARQQGTRSFELRAALALAKLYQSTARPIDAHAILDPALEGFSPTPEMPEIAEAQALLAALQDIDEVKADLAQRRRMTQLQADYGAALISARGYGAPETTETFARARESAPGDRDAPERLAADYGLWAGSYTRGELPAMRKHAAVFVRDVEARPDSPEAAIAHRVQAKTHYFAGEFVEAVRELERALALFEPGRDDDLAVRFPPDPGVASMIYLAFASWALGEADRAVSFIERMGARIAELSHVPTLAFGRVLEAFFALMRGDRPRARTSVSALARIVRDHDLPEFRAFGEFLVGWATIDSGALADGLEAMRRGAESLRRQNVVVYDGLVKIALAEAEARAGDPDRALKILDDALATCDRMGYRTYECELHRVRGELLLGRHAADPAPAEHAFKTAIAVAKEQGARSYELLASLSLAKLYQSTGRPVDAHAVLAPALEGFAPTPEMPEIAEAEALLKRLGLR